MRALADLAGDGAATVSALAFRMRRSRASDLSVARNELKKGPGLRPRSVACSPSPCPACTSSVLDKTNKEATRHTLTRPRVPHFLNAVADYDDQYRRLNRVTLPGHTPIDVHKPRSRVVAGDVSQFSKVVSPIMLAS